VGGYLNEHFVASFQKVGTFRIVNGQKQGGNVAVYFCTPGGRVLHAVAGPVPPATLLKEARWVISTWDLGLLESKGVGGRSRFTTFVAEAHSARMRQGGDPALLARVQRLLADAPLPRLAAFYPIVWEDLLNEKVSTVPVLEGAAAGATGGGRRRGRAPDVADEGQQERLQDALLACATRTPKAADIRSGRALNDLLRELQALRSSRLRGPEEPLHPDLLGKIGLTDNPGAETLSALALFAREGRFNWPPLLCQDLFAPARERFQAAAQMAVPQAARGRLSPEGLAGLHKALAELERTLYVASGLGEKPTVLIQGSRYLRQLTEEVRSLPSPGAASRLAGRASPRGRTVAELLEDLSQRGLCFAPAEEGSALAYTTLYKQLAAYGTAIGNAWDPWE